MKRITLISLVVILALSTLAFNRPPKGDDMKASVSIIHGIPGKDLGLEDNALPVDILVNDALCTLQSFKFGEIAGPLSLAAGTYNIKISLANSEVPCSNAPVLDLDVPFAAGENATVIAHLTTDERLITASKFENDVAGRKSRVTIRHTANAPAVDIKVEGWSKNGKSFSMMVEDLTNPNQAGPVFVSPKVSYEATIYPAGSMDALMGPLPLSFEKKTAYFIYAVGSLVNGTFTLLPYTINLK